MIVITAAGVFAAIFGGFPILRTGWIFWSLILFSISGLAFGFKVAPLQKSIVAHTSNHENADNFDWNELHKIYKSWDIWGLVAVLTSLAAFVMMTLKIPQ